MRVLYHSRFLLAASVAVLIAAACGDGAGTDDSPVDDGLGGSGGDESAMGGSGGTDSSDGGTSSAGAAGSANDPVPGLNVAFVTSAQYAPEELGGLSGADAKCQALASAAGLEGRYVAWLSDSEDEAKERVGKARGWVRTDGRPFADALSQLGEGEHYYPLNVDESGNRVEASRVITGSHTDGGRAAGEESDFCSNWTAESGFGAVAGYTDHGGPTWSYGGEYTFAQIGCDEPARLYCLGIDASDPLEVDFPATRRAFVSELSPSNQMGIAYFDEVCADEAETAGLSGTYLALLPTVGASAASRFATDSGLPWGRTDGVPLMDSPAELVSATLLAPINRLADGSLIEAYAYVTTAAATPATDGVAGVENDETMPGTCNDWAPASYSFEYTRGFAHRSDEGWWDYDSHLGCNTWSRIYCFEQ